MALWWIVLLVVISVGTLVTVTVAVAEHGDTKYWYAGRLTIHKRPYSLLPLFIGPPILGRAYTVSVFHRGWYIIRKQGHG